MKKTIFALCITALIGGGTAPAKNRDKNNIIIIVRDGEKKQMTKQEIEKGYIGQGKEWNTYLQGLYRAGKISRVIFKELKK